MTREDATGRAHCTYALTLHRARMHTDKHTIEGGSGVEPGIHPYFLLGDAATGRRIGRGLQQTVWRVGMRLLYQDTRSLATEMLL
jgi:hypothetical protein